MTSENDVNTVVAMIAFILSFSAMFFNFILIFIIIRTSVLHTNTNFLLVSLLVGELLVAIFVTPFAGLAKMSYHFVSWDTYCVISGFCHALGNSAAFLSLLMVCIDRCVAVSRPLKYSSIIGKCSVTGMISYAWIHSLALTLFPFTSNSAYVFSSRYSLCVILTDRQAEFSFVKGFFGSFIPAFMILCTVLKIIKEAKSHHRIFAVIVPSHLYNVSTQRKNLSYSRTTLRALRALLVIICCYSLFRMPLNILFVVDVSNKGTLSKELVTSFVWLSFLCGVINPVVIIIFNKTFKQKFLKTVCVVYYKLLKKETREYFSVSSGLQSVLETSLIINKLQQMAMYQSLSVGVTMTSSLRADNKGHLVINRSVSSPSFA